ncbi:glycosyltransferase [Halobacillus halophilus]|uniref:glycosyltransferase family 4 protein n=1 Tax=Halobacillus halophilus TaxID=1570 RepID=UPI00136E8521|nr:glycosyltransferase family 4 protein [Halobacillus halophilus]MYL30807.1 glycosyltransferase [Halobacillus halophilus]
MKVLYLHQHFEYKKSGTRSYQFARWLVEQGHEVTLITGMDHDYKWMDGIRVLSTKTKYCQTFSFLKRLMAFLHFVIMSFLLMLRTKEADVIYATSTPLTVGIPAVLASRIKRIPMVFEIRDVWPDVPIELGILKNKWMIGAARKLEGWIYAHAVHLVTLSDAMKENVQSKVPGKRVTTIPNLANNQWVDHLPIDTNQMLKDFPCLDHPFKVIHHGSMGRVNHVEYLIDLAEKSKEIRYIAIGSGAEKEKLQRLKKERKVDNLFILDEVDKTTGYYILSMCQVGIVTVADFEILNMNSANKFFDYLASRLPVVLNYEGWQKEVLNRCQAGNGFPFAEQEAIVDYLRLLKNDENLYTAASANAKNAAISHFDADKLSERFENVLISSLPEEAEACRKEVMPEAGRRS